MESILAKCVIIGIHSFLATSFSFGLLSRRGANANNLNSYFSNRISNNNDLVSLPQSSGDSLPNDYKKNRNWNLSGEYGINAVGAWRISSNEHKVRVGVIDTGIQEHEDIKANLAPGWDFYNGNATTNEDPMAHGTHVAGIIGAIANNGIGIPGICHNVEIVPLQTRDERGSFSPRYTSDAIKYATNLWGTEQQIDILNYSVGGFGTINYFLGDIMDFPGLFVWAAGNDAHDVDSDINGFESFNLPNLISVGAIDSDVDAYKKTNYSSSGDNINIYAPGGHIYSLSSDNGYRYDTGTSMAAPHVSGVAALLLSNSNNLEASDIKEKILSSSSPLDVTLPSGKSQTVKYLNAYKALESLHSHSYSDSYKWLNEKTHRAYCLCGLYMDVGHAVRKNSSVCSICGGKASMGFIDIGS